MTQTAAATRQDIDDVLSILDVMMTRIDTRFNASEAEIKQTNIRLGNIENQLDTTQKQNEISEEEQLVIDYQMTQVQNWVEKAAKHINIPFTR